MADDGTTQNQQQPAEPKEPQIPKSRLDAKEAENARLRTELDALRPKAQGYDAVNQQVTEWQSKAQQAQAEAGFVKAFARHGFVEDEEIAHLAQAYSAAQSSVAADKRMTPHAWLERGIQDPNSLGMVTGTYVSARLASRSGSAAVSQPASPPAPAAPGPQTPPVLAPPAFQAPASNAGVRAAPNPAAKMSEAEQRAIAGDPKRFKEWREGEGKETYEKVAQLRPARR